MEQAKSGANGKSSGRAQSAARQESPGISWIACGIIARSIYIEEQWSVRLQEKAEVSRTRRLRGSARRAGRSRVLQWLQLNIGHGSHDASQHRVGVRVTVARHWRPRAGVGQGLPQLRRR